MKKKVVLLKSMKHDYESITETEGDLSYYLENDYVQLSEIVEIDFPELNNDSVIKTQVAVLDKQITKVMADSEVQINKLKARKQELLAITHNKVEP